MRAAAFVIVALLVAGPAAAEPTPLRWPVESRTEAARISDVLAWTAIGLDTVHSSVSDDRRHAFGCQAARMGLSIGINLAVKNLVHRDRPDHSNHYSFYSGHSSNAMAAAGWRYAIGVPIAVGAGYLRVAAGKHYVSDVLTGLGVGFAASKVCR